MATGRKEERLPAGSGGSLQLPARRARARRRHADALRQRRDGNRRRRRRARVAASPARARSRGDDSGAPAGLRVAGSPRLAIALGDVQQLPDTGASSSAGGRPGPSPSSRRTAAFASTRPSATTARLLPRISLSVDRTAHVDPGGRHRRRTPTGRRPSTRARTGRPRSRGGKSSAGKRRRLASQAVHTVPRSDPGTAITVRRRQRLRVGGGPRRTGKEPQSHRRRSPSDARASRPRGNAR